MPSHNHTRKELEHTWQRFRCLPPPRVLKDEWPKVVPQPGGTLDASDGAPSGSSTPVAPRTKVRANNGFATPSPSSRGSMYAWVTALVACDELQTYRDVDTLLRRAVELLREALKLERAAVFILRDAVTLHGTFGTGLAGETTDERHIAFELGQSHREAFALASQGLAQWSRFPNVPLFAQRDNETVVLRTGENAIVPILAAGRSLGLIACDQGFSGSAIDPETLIRAAVFARVLGPCVTRLTPFENRRFDSTSSDAQTAPEAASANVELVGAAIRRLRLDPNEPRYQLAKALGTTADRLGRVFKAEMGESLPEYRNKLRLQRFFALVDPHGGDLLSAALGAGFGSYAQFNRVFHQCHGMAPNSYLRRRLQG